MAKIGRPSKYSDAILKEICDRLSEGEPLAQICRDEKMPAPCTVRSWMNGLAEGVDAENVSSAIACARELGFDRIAVDGLNIVDNLEEDPASRRVRSDFRLKLLAKWDPKRYGELIKLSGADGEGPVPLVTMNADMTAAQAAEAYAKLLG